MSTLKNLLLFEADELESSFKKASVEGKGTPQEVSDRRENIVTKFISKYYPFPYKVTKGNITDSENKRSDSIDCLILNPSHPHTISNDKYSVIFADGVDIAIEVKPDLNSKKEIERSLNQIISVKKLTRLKSGILKIPYFDEDYSELYVENCKKIPCVVFSIKTYKDPRILIEKIVDYYEKNHIKRVLQFDFIFVNNNFILMNSRTDSYIHCENCGEGIFIHEYGKESFAALLLYLNLLPESHIRNSSTIIEHYLTYLTPKKQYGYNDLNKRLLEIEKKTKHTNGNRKL